MLQYDRAGDRGKTSESTENRRGAGHSCKKSRYLPDSVSISTSQWAGEQFQAGKDGVIFIGACGIAVRSIAPYIAGKKTDPAVLVIDECGQFVSSLLSGHLGGCLLYTSDAADDR